MVGDLLIICAYSMYSEAELENYQPVVVLVDEHNRPLQNKNLKLAR
jgi:aspartate 1-decarboxylase